MIYIPQKKWSAAAPTETTNDEKKAGPSLCPLVTIDSITKRSAAAPTEATSDGEDETRVQKIRKSAMAAQVSTN